MWIRCWRRSALEQRSKYESQDFREHGNMCTYWITGEKFHDNAHLIFQDSMHDLNSGWQEITSQIYENPGGHITLPRVGGADVKHKKKLFFSLDMPLCTTPKNKINFLFRTTALQLQIQTKRTQTLMLLVMLVIIVSMLAIQIRKIQITMVLEMLVMLTSMEMVITTF